MCAHARAVLSWKDASAPGELRRGLLPWFLRPIMTPRFPQFTQISGVPALQINSNFANGLQIYCAVFFPGFYVYGGAGGDSSRPACRSPSARVRAHQRPVSARQRPSAPVSGRLRRVDLSDKHTRGGPWGWGRAGEVPRVVFGQSGLMPLTAKRRDFFCGAEQVWEMWHVHTGGKRARPVFFFVARGRWRPRASAGHTPHGCANRGPCAAASPKSAEIGRNRPKGARFG